jgi:hypothetical protein
LDVLQQTPSSTLLSPEEAKERLREIVEGFFFRRRKEEGAVPARHLLVRSPPGLGKTKEAMEWATRYQTEQEGKKSILQLSRRDVTSAGAWAQVAIFVPRHELAREVKEVIERNRGELGAPVEVPVLRGRDNGADKGRAPCQRWREAQDLGGKGLPVYSNLCRRRHQREISECPHFGDCEYIRDWRAAYAAPYVILVHSHLGVGWESTGIVRGAFGRSAENDRPQFEHSFSPANAAIVVCDEDPTTSLIQRTRLDSGVIGTIEERRLGDHILAGLASAGGLLDYLREKEITPEEIRLTVGKLRKREQKRGQISNPSASDAVLERDIKSASSLVRLSGILQRLADELASGRPGGAYSLIAAGDGLVSQGRRPWPFKDRRLLVLDGTANPDILREFVPTLAAMPPIRVHRKARVIQVSNSTFFKGSVISRTASGRGKGKPELSSRLLEVAEFIEKTARTGRTLVVTNKPVRCALTGEEERDTLPISAKYHGADVAHFGNLRGSNEFEEHEIAIILGRDEPSVRAAERAMAIWYDTKEPIRCIRADVRGRVNYRTRTRRYLLRDGSTNPLPCRSTPTPASKPSWNRLGRPRWCRRSTGCG